MSDQANRQVSTLQRPTTNDPEAWKIYWKGKHKAGPKNLVPLYSVSSEEDVTQVLIKWDPTPSS